MIRLTRYPRWLKGPAVQLFLFCAGAFLLYFPNIDRSFASDDFLVMKRIGLDHVVRIPDFFRPLSDLSLALNYFLGGFQPVGYYALNILLHGVSSYLFYLFCLRLRWTNDDRLGRRWAFVAALLFLAYPFHSEGVVWILGRGASLAGVFGMMGLLAVLSRRPLFVRVVAAAVCYFVAMAAYESILLFPLMVFILVGFRRGAGRREWLAWGGALGGSFLIHLLVRYWFSGGITGTYGRDFFGQPMTVYAGNLFRLAERLFLPPLQQMGVIVVVFLVVAGVIVFVSLLFWRRTLGAAELAGARRLFIQLLLLLAVSSWVPVVSGVSLHTTESDRFLYLPSYFLCGAVALLLVVLARRVDLMAGILVLLVGYEVVQVARVNRNWERASAITRSVLDRVLRYKEGRVVLFNLPDEVDGAFVFRLGLPEAVAIGGMDPSRLLILNHLRRGDVVRMPKVRDPIDIVLVWNGEELVQLNAEGR